MPEELSAPVKDLLKQLLNVDAATRITAHATLRHSWLQVQLINAPNMDKMRLETAILISDKPADDLDDEVIGELEKFGMQRDEVVRLVLTKTHSSLATLYYLLLDTIVTRRKTMKRPSSGHGGVISSSGLSGSGAYRTKPSSTNGGSNGITNAGNQVTPATTHMAVGGALKAKLGGDAGVAAALAAATAAQYENQAEAMAAQQTMADQMAQKLEQQQQIDRQEYRLRPKSASQNRTSGAQQQRPLSAYAGRR
jgi:hypothetical protein